MLACPANPDTLTFIVIERTLDDLMLDLRQRRTAGERAPVLLLGAGASVESGIGAMDDLFAFTKQPDFAAFVKYIEPQTTAERFRLLAQFLQTRQPSQVTPGYQALAALCADAFFDLVLTLNLDPLLDDALANARLWRKDYLIVVNGVYRPDRVGALLTAQSPRVKVVKLHGDLFHRYMAWTPKEMDGYVSDIADVLRAALYGRDLLVVGTSLRDERIRELAQHVCRSGGSVWFLGLKSAPDFLRTEENARIILSPDCAFEKLFPRLAVEFGVIEAPAAESASRAAPAATPTMDDFMASVVTVLAPGGHDSHTGFLLEKPRVIVTDAYPVRNFGKTAKISIRAGGQVFELKRVAEDQHPFGPGVYAAPKDLAMPGLRLDARAMKKRDRVHFAIAAGERTGIGSGTVAGPRERTVPIPPLGPVRNVVELEAFVAPGASGAPVVDDRFRVRGFITGGSRDPSRPVTFMHPAARWKHVLALNAKG
jgi:hypothetical protein